MSVPPSDQEKQAAARQLLNAPPLYAQDPIFAMIPMSAWARRGYQYTLTVQWPDVFVPNQTDTITVHAQVHYAWNAGRQIWTRLAGDAWVSGLPDWSTPTTAAVIALVPAEPPDPDYHG
ncbi:hypothetical protein [Lysobacter antibioticus]|uniref:hypothetical protein n=1 Tax=Lysobacter antibioticus TaxID=84531 RepID=UPI0007E8B989|nr:hypothetical protein [Lysobacter antibioticus]